MTKYINHIALAMCIVILCSLKLVADDDKKLGFYERLDEYVPMDLEFTNSTGEVLKMKDIIDKPTVFAMVYYSCPGICSPLLAGLSDVIERTNIIPGEEYQVITISFDHTENYKVAAKWRENYISAMRREINPDGWRFMTGDSVSIRKMTDALGFHFIADDREVRKDTVDYVHAGGLIVVSPEGKITRYHYGERFLPFNLKMSVVEAARGESRPAVAAILDFCFKYEPDGKKYVFDVLKVSGILMMTVLGGFIMYLVIITKKDKQKRMKEES